MRGFISLVCMFLAVSLIPASADDCVPVKTAKNEYVTFKKRGYAPVKVMIYIVVPDGTAPEQVSVNAKYRFAIRDTTAKIRLGREVGDSLDRIEHCTFVPKSEVAGLKIEETRLLVRGKFIGTTSREFILGSAIFLPSELIARKPIVMTRLNSGILYMGTWGKDGGIDSLVLRAMN